MNHLLPIFITLAVVVFLIILVVISYTRKRGTGKIRYTQPNTSTQNVEYTYMKCERCNKRNYINKNSIFKRCNNCGWNLAEPYINTSFQLTRIPKELQGNLHHQLKEDEQVQLRTDLFHDFEENGTDKGTYSAAIAVYNSKNQRIGWVPENISHELLPKVSVSIKIFAKITRKSPSGIEILVTNDVQRMWG